MEVLSVFILAAILIESVVNVIQNLKAEETSWKYWLSLGLGLVISVLVAFNWNLDLFKLAGFAEPRIPYVGEILTGLILSRGSNVASDLIGLIRK